jgi:uncharacterized protein YaaR (DUF327 family)
MERIDPSGRPLYSPERKSKKSDRKKSNSLSFSRFFEDGGPTKTGDGGIDEMATTDTIAEAAGESTEESVERMLDAIHAIGEKIRENATFEAVSNYRNAVRSFIKYVVSNALVVDEKRSSPNILRQKKFTLIKVIDQKLERLASGVLIHQHDTLDLLAKIDEINGLLVNLIR